MTHDEKARIAVEQITAERMKQEALTRHITGKRTSYWEQRAAAQEIARRTDRKQGWK